MRPVGSSEFVLSAIQELKGQLPLDQRVKIGRALVDTIEIHHMDNPIAVLFLSSFKPAQENLELIWKELKEAVRF